MRSMLRISEAASMALHTMGLLAFDPKRAMSNREIASVLNVSSAHLAKVMQRLNKAGLVRSRRGPKGGFCLERRSEEITLLEVYEATDGPLEERGCLLDKKICTGNCILGGLLTSTGRELKRYLSQTRVSDISRFKYNKEHHERDS